MGPCHRAMPPSRKEDRRIFDATFESRTEPNRTEPNHGGTAFELARPATAAPRPPARYMAREPRSDMAAICHCRRSADRDGSVRSACSITRLLMLAKRRGPRRSAEGEWARLNQGRELALGGAARSGAGR